MNTCMRKIAGSLLLATAALAAGVYSADASTPAPYVLQHTAHGFSKSHEPREINPGHQFTLRSLRWRNDAVAHGTLSDSAGSTPVVIHMSQARTSHHVTYYRRLLYQTVKMGDYMHWSWSARQWEFCQGSC